MDWWWMETDRQVIKQASKTEGRWVDGWLVGECCAGGWVGGKRMAWMVYTWLVGGRVVNG